MTSTPRAMNTATVHDDGTAVIDLDGQIHQLTAPSIDQARALAMALALDHARASGQPVLIFAQDPHAQHLLEVHPDATIRPLRPAPTSAEPSRGTAPGTPPRRYRWLIPVAVLAAATALAYTATRPWTGSDHQHAATSPSPPQPSHPVQLDAAVAAGTTSPVPPRSPGRHAQPRWIAAASWEKARAVNIQARELARAATQSPPVGSGTRRPAPAAAPVRSAVLPPAPRSQSPPRQPDQPSAVVKPNEPAAVIEPAPPDTQTLPHSPLDPTNPDAGGS